MLHKLDVEKVNRNTISKPESANKILLLKVQTSIHKKIHFVRIQISNTQSEKRV